MKPTTVGLLMSAAVLLSSRPPCHQADAFTVHPSSFHSYPVNKDNTPDDALRAESERLQTRLREQHLKTAVDSASAATTPGTGTTGGAHRRHHDVDRSTFERILVQLAAEYVQDTTELCKTKPSEVETEGSRAAAAAAALPTQAPRSSDPSSSAINERLPAFLKPIPSNSTAAEAAPTMSGSGALAAATTTTTSRSGADDEPTFSGGQRVGKRQRVSRFLSGLNPFRGQGTSRPPSEAVPAAPDARDVVDIDDCPSWA